jgi:hypothetical protein
LSRDINDIISANNLNFEYGEWTHISETYKTIEETNSISKTNQDYPIYTENYVFDENKSVKWNKDEVIRRNKLRDEEVMKCRSTRRQALCNFENNIIHCIAVELMERNILKTDISTAVEKAIKIFDLAWDKGHSAGIYEVCIYIDEIVDFIEDIVS